MYESAISLLSSADTRDAVISMLSVKAYQAAIIRELLFAQRSTATPYGTNAGSLTQSFADLTNKLAGSSVTGSIVDGNNQPTLVPTTGFGVLKTKSRDLHCKSLAAFVMTKFPVVPECCSVYSHFRAV